MKARRFFYQILDVADLLSDEARNVVREIGNLIRILAAFIAGSALIILLV